MTRILVTGGCGFVGSHVVDSLLKRGHRVIIVDDLSTGSHKNKKARFHRQTITDQAALASIFSKERPKVVVHAAAQVSVPLSIHDPRHDAHTNILGTLNILECLKEFKVAKIVHLSTGGALYGNPSYLPADENHPIRPLSPYGLSKYVVERYLELYHQLWGIDFIALRFSNVYGPRDLPQSGHVIPSFISNLKKKRRVTINGSGKQGRDFIYVEDVANAVMLAMGSKTQEQYLNIGSEQVTSILELHRILQRIMKNNRAPIFVKGRAGDVDQICLDASKARKVLGWRATVSLVEGLKRTVEWFERN